MTASAARRRYRCADGGHIRIACEREAQWRALAKCIGRPELAYAGSWEAARSAPPRGALGRVVETLFAEDAAEVWVRRLEAHGVPFARLT
jgi:crotonobetainyl-CoA:carnitine CoA-transferase CaiB-like acyl-CoA transferase